MTPWIMVDDVWHTSGAILGTSYASKQASKATNATLELDGWSTRGRHRLEAG